MNTVTTSKKRFISFTGRSSAIIHSSQISPGNVLRFIILSKKNYATQAPIFKGTLIDFWYERLFSMASLTT